MMQTSGRGLLLMSCLPIVVAYCIIATLERIRMQFIQLNFCRRRRRPKFLGVWLMIMGAEGAKFFENQGVANLLNNLYPWVGVGGCLAKTSDLRLGTGNY